MNETFIHFHDVGICDKGRLKGLIMGNYKANRVEGAKGLTYVGLMTHSQVPCWIQVGSNSIKQRNCLRLEACSQLSTLKWVEGHVKALGWD
jgi:hypothetical protein